MKKRTYIFDFARESKKLWNNKLTFIPIIIDALGKVTNKGTGGHGNKRTKGDYPKNSINEIGQNTEKSPGDLRRIAVTKTPVEDHLLTLM